MALLTILYFSKAVDHKSLLTMNKVTKMLNLCVGAILCVGYVEIDLTSIKFILSIISLNL